MDRALTGNGPAPLALRKFLLATGERGLGYHAVFGNHVLSIHEFELYSMIQQRVLLASDPEGRSEMRRDQAIFRAIEMDKAEERGTYTPPTEPVDFERMSPEELDAWMRNQSGFDD